MKKKLIILVVFLLSAGLYAQDGNSSYSVLRFPTSARVAALGGENITICEDTPWAGSANPALYATVSDRSLGLNFMTYPSGGTRMGAEYVAAFGDRHTAAFSASLMNYGEMDETDETGTVLGTFSPKDIVVGAAYSYLLSDFWAGGAALKMVSSSYGGFNAMALAVDLGLNYYDEEADFSFSAVMRNVGAQIKSFDGRTQTVPYNLQVGVSKKMAHAPLRFSVTLTDLTRWKTSDYFHPEGEELSFGKKLLNHVVAGAEVLLTERIYISAGYNFRRAYELKAAGSGHGAGLTFGAGIHTGRLKISGSYAKYHVSSASLMFNVGYSL